MNIYKNTISDMAANFDGSRPNDSLSTDTSHATIQQPRAASYLLFATSRAVPDSVSPALVKRGDCNRQRTWYQWVSGSVGAVDSHTVILRRECAGRAAVRQGDPSRALWSCSGGAADLH